MKKLGKTYIETHVEVPTKFLKGKQYYKVHKIWAPIPHEVIDEAHLRKLHQAVETSYEGFVEVLVESQNNRFTPRYYKIRGIVEVHIQIEEGK